MNKIGKQIIYKANPNAMPQSGIITDVSNNGDEKINSTVLNVELLDGSGDSIGVLGVELPEVDSKSTSKLKMSIAVDVMHTRDVKFSFAE